MRTTERITSIPGSIVAAINSIPAGMLAPVVDGRDGILPELPNTLITSRKFTPVDFMGGHCTTEGRTFVGGPPQDFVTESDVARLVFKRWGTHIVSQQTISSTHYNDS